MPPLRKIAFFETESWEKDWLVKNLGGCTLKFYDQQLDADRALPPDRDFSAISVGANSRVGEGVLEAFARLELLAARTRDCDGVDLAACRRRKVMVCRLPRYAVHAVAEFTFALILALSRKICQARRTRGFDLFGKTLGVLGTGNIGSAVIRIANGFGMRVLAWNPKQNLQLAAELGFSYVPPELLLSESDIVTLHVPYIAADAPNTTERFIDRAALSHMKHGALLINTAHEKLLDPDALSQALTDGALGGAGLDVAPDTVLAKKLAAFDNVVLTPRIAFNTQQTRERVLHMTVENILAYFRGFPQNVVGENVKPEG